LTGTIKTIRDERSFGFITGDDGVNYFFHATGLQGLHILDLKLGDVVTFSPTQTPKGARAEGITKETAVATT
jgi:CspA family cold shock protein